MTRKDRLVGRRTVFGCQNIVWRRVCFANHPVFTMSAVPSLLRVSCRHSSCRNVVQTSIRRLRRWNHQAVVVKATSAHQNEPRESGSPLHPAAMLLLAAAALHQNDPNATHSESSEPRRANLSRFQSMNARGMNHKYTVDWKVVLGEGAYGSVHPARLAATGEKVRWRSSVVIDSLQKISVFSFSPSHLQVALKRISRRFTNTQGFKAETQALLRIYDNGGHPNISGLRGECNLFLEGDN